MLRNTIVERRRSNAGAHYSCEGAVMHQQTIASIHESIVNTVRAGLLARNIFIVLPARRQWTYMGKNFVGYLQLRDSL